MKPFRFYLVCLSLVFVTPHGNAAQSAIVGQTAPDFKLADTHGNMHSLSGYRGKYVVLEWVNHDCPFVRKHYDSGNMQGLQKDVTAQDVVWLSIGSSAPGKQGNFTAEEWNTLTLEKRAAPTAVLLDPTGHVGRMYEAKTTPHMYVIDPEGQLVYQGAIDNIASANPADIPKAENYVKSCLNQCLAGEPVSTPITRAYGCSVKY